MTTREAPQRDHPGAKTRNYINSTAPNPRSTSSSPLTPRRHDAATTTATCHHGTQPVRIQSQHTPHPNLPSSHPLPPHLLIKSTVGYGRCLFCYCCCSPGCCPMFCVLYCSTYSLSGGCLPSLDGVTINVWTLATMQHVDAGKIAVGCWHFISGSEL